MTMITASTALTIFIMNIHHCGPEARPVPQWARRFILNHLARICFVYEVGENCLGGASAGKRASLQEVPEALLAGHNNARGMNWDVNGQAWVGRGGEDGAGPGFAKQTDWKEDLFVSIDHSEEEGAAGGRGASRGGSGGGGGGGGYTQEKKGVGGAEGGAGPGGEGGGASAERRKEILVKTQCVCQHQGLRRNIEYIASCYQDQRHTARLIGEWRKVAKVMDRFFMWLFFIMVFFMSLLIMGKAI